MRFLYRLVRAGVVLATGVVVATTVVRAYPPAVGILSKNRSCTSCHADNGPWSDEANTIIDILDAKTRSSLKGPDGRFQIDVPRMATRTVLTVIGRTPGDKLAPRRNAWAYVDTSQIATSSLSKFAPGWDVNLPMSCRVVGDSNAAYPNAVITSLPMTLRPTDAARDAELELQVMLTSGESVKGQAKMGMISNYLVRKVRLKVLDQ